VSSNKWSCAEQSRDGEYICGCAVTKDEHVIRIWEAGSGALAVVLEGPSVGLHSVSWLPSPSRCDVLQCLAFCCPCSAQLAKGADLKSCQWPTHAMVEKGASAVSFELLLLLRSAHSMQAHCSPCYCLKEWLPAEGCKGTSIKGVSINYRMLRAAVGEQFFQCKRAS
jgi:hypothetical protein